MKFFLHDITGLNFSKSSTGVGDIIRRAVARAHGWIGRPIVLREVYAGDSNWHCWVSDNKVTRMHFHTCVQCGMVEILLCVKVPSTK